MAQFAVLIAGLLLSVESQASDVVDSSALQGFLSNYVPAATQRTPTSLNGYVPQGLSEAEYKAARNAEDAKKAQNKQRFPKGKATLDIADWLKQMEQKQTFNGDKFSGSGHTYAKQKFESKSAFDKANGRTSGSSPFKNPFSKFVLPAANSFTIIDDKPSLQANTVEEKSEQKLLANDSNMPITLPAIGVGLLALVTMLGARLWRGSQPATILAGNNMTEMRSQSPAVYAISPSSPAMDEALEGTYLGTPSGPFDPLGTYESSARKAEINNGRLAMVGITSLSGRPAGRKVHSSTALGVFGKTRASQRKFVPAVSQSELSPGKAVSGICAGLDICIAVDTDGSVYALGNKSPVLGTPMAAGRVSDGLIKDPLTGTSFNVRSGAVEGPWCPNFPFSILFSVIEPTGLPVFKCKTGGGAVQVEVDVNAKTNFESGYWKGILDAQGKTDGGYY